MRIPHVIVVLAIFIATLSAAPALAQTPPAATLPQAFVLTWSDHGKASAPSPSDDTPRPNDDDGNVKVETYVVERDSVTRTVSYEAHHGTVPPPKTETAKLRDSKAIWALLPSVAADETVRLAAREGTGERGQKIHVVFEVGGKTLDVAGEEPVIMTAQLQKLVELKHALDDALTAKSKKSGKKK